MFSMECQFCHTEFNEAEGSCPSCGLKVDNNRKLIRLKKFKESVLADECKAVKKKLKLRGDLDLKFYYCKKNRVLAELKDLNQITSVDFDYLLVLVRYQWKNLNWTNRGCRVVGFYDALLDRVHNVCLTDKLYLPDSYACFYSDNFGYNICGFRLSTPETMDQIKMDQIKGLRSFYEMKDPWDLTNLDEEVEAKKKG